MNNSHSQTTINVPRKVFDSMLEAYKKWEKFTDELEDFILSSDEEFLSKMRKAKEEHGQGKVRDWAALKKEEIILYGVDNRDSIYRRLR